MNHAMLALTAFGKRASTGAGLAATIAVLSCSALVSAANAGIITDPATTFLGTLTLSGTTATISDSWYNTDFGSFGDATVLASVQSEFGSSVTQTAGTLGNLGDCGNGPTTCSGSGSKSAFTYSGTAADIFAIHWGGGQGGDQPLLEIMFSQAVTSFSLSGFAHGVSFARAFESGGTTGETGSSVAPLPAALPLMGSVLGFGYIASRWRRRRGSNMVVA